MGISPILLEILRNRFKTITEEMAMVTLRTAHTVFVKETGDFGSCLLAPGGETFAAPTGVSVSHMIGRPTKKTLETFDYVEGDIGITNDPELTQGLSTHLPDIWLWKPIFHEGEIIAFVLNFIHSSDVGGRVPGSVSPTNTEIFQEGLRIPPAKLYKGGELNRELLDMVLYNCRIPDQNWGDMKAQIAALNTAERRMREVIERYGVDNIRAGIAGLMDRAEERARALIREIPDGRYTFSEYMEGDVAGLRPIRIKLTLEVKDSEIMLDFTGTDLQVQAALNLPTWNQKGHYTLCVALLNYFRTVDPEIPYNSGLVRPIHVHAPYGSLLNPHPHMAVGVRAATMLRIVDLVTACMSQALPHLYPAASSGATSIVLVSTLNVRTGERIVSVAQPLIGGSGARPMIDGVDGTSFTGGWLRNIPNEVLESDMPIMIEEYGYGNHTVSPGKFRGGASIKLRIKSFSPDTQMSARGLERFTFRPWGRKGGKPGQLGSAILNPGSPDEVNVGKIDLLTLQPGDTIEFESATGGGFGNPLERDPERVLADVEAGFMDVTQAREDYGVVIRDEAIDEEATRKRRASLPQPSLPEFDLGPEREAYDELWSDEIQSTLVHVVSQHPMPLRPYVLRKMITKIEAGHAAGQTPMPNSFAQMAQDVIASLDSDALEMAAT